jgi:glutathione synthase/RimK-type ligase-like ATP-grasp enzyme
MGESTAHDGAAHYQWAGLDFLVDRDGTPVFIEANRASHMLGEYMQFHGDERPFEIIAGVMNRAAGPACLFWRKNDPFPDADEDACFIGRHMANYLEQRPVICNVEDNQEPRDELVSRDGRQVRPGSIFRWWYGLPWVYERTGATVINPNCVWVAVRDKLVCSQTLAGAESFRVPGCFAVGNPSEVQRLLVEHDRLFADGYVLKPRVGWGGHGVQVADPGEVPRAIKGDYLLSERIISQRTDDRFWEARVFVMGGVYLGGVRHTSRSPMTNYWQGGTAEPLNDATSALLERPALEAVRLIVAAAERIHRLPQPPDSPLVHVIYEGTGM